jgi:hypothetical protein
MPSNTQPYGNAQSEDITAAFPQEEHNRSEDVQRYLQGVRFPATKYDLVEHAVERQAPSRIVDILNQLPTSEHGNSTGSKLTVYKGFDDLIREIDSSG